MFLSAVSPTFSLVLDARDKPEGLIEKAGSVCEEYEKTRVSNGLMFLRVLVPAQLGCP